MIIWENYDIHQKDRAIYLLIIIVVFILSWKNNNKYLSLSNINDRYTQRAPQRNNARLKARYYRYRESLFAVAITIDYIAKVLQIANPGIRASCI